eukprot:GHVO01056455.1.p1 GENE.GHVO01056455.1~~GHVO01056455.1.p1  ORF type:complete len:291 (-),score=29.33 GHVO01056455.1:270-1142(-)
MTPTPAEGYIKFIQYAEKKTHLRWDKMIILGFMAGFWLGVWAHISTRTAGNFYIYGDASAAGTCTLVYGALFPGGLMAITFTGCELYTGNIAAMWMYVLDAKCKGWKVWGNFLKVTGCSVFMNMVGGVFVAWFFSYLSGAFEEGPHAEYLQYLAHKKGTYSFGHAFILSTACNIIVCLAVFCAGNADTVIAKVFILWFIIACFCWGGFEHVVANFYTVSAGIMLGSDVTVGDMILKNWLPCWFGNTVGGIVFTGTVWWYTLKPQEQKLVYKGSMDNQSELEQIASGSTVE